MNLKVGGEGGTEGGEGDLVQFCCHLDHSESIICVVAQPRPHTIPFNY